MARVYYALPGSILRPEDVQAVGEEVDALTAKHGGILQNEELVEEAKDANLTVHGYIYNCDDATAAHGYRIQRARQVQSGYGVRAEEGPRAVRHGLEGTHIDWERGLRARTYVPPAKDVEPAAPEAEPPIEAQGGYRDTLQVLADDDLKARAMRQLARWIAGYLERADVFAQDQLVWGEWCEVTRKLLGMYG